MAKKKELGSSIKQSVLLAAGVATIIGVGVMVSRWLASKPCAEDIVIFICDQKGMPIQGAAIVGPSYMVIYPDERGRASLPGSWLGKSIAVHERGSWRLVIRRKLSTPGKESTVMIVVPDDILEGGQVIDEKVR